MEEEKNESRKRKREPRPMRTDGQIGIGAGLCRRGAPGERCGVDREDTPSHCAPLGLAISYERDSDRGEQEHWTEGPTTDWLQLRV